MSEYRIFRVIRTEGNKYFDIEYVQDLVTCAECEKAHLTYDGDCKYCDEWKDDDGNYIEVYHDGNFYCGYGVRKESE